ncbi:MAG: hypothetical protein HRU03_07875 [Nanoarchaeales archaeon]|nr:hypothetical protein [Nanoarchaeales archaeon]
METINLSDMSIEELKVHSQKVLDLLIIKNAKEKLSNGEKLISAEEVFRKLEKC